MIAAEDERAFESNLTRSNYKLAARTENFARYISASPDLPEIDVLFVDSSTFTKLEENAISLQRGKHDFRVPDLSQLIALKLHAIRNQPQREQRDLPDIAELLRLNSGRIRAKELNELCEKFGPLEIGSKLQRLL